MRDYKFRVWDKENKRIITHEQDFIPLKICSLGVLRLDPTNKEDLWHISPIERFEIMQFIGGYGYKGDYDKRFDNRVELYEGDIVEAWSEGIKGTFEIRLRQEAQPTFMLYPAFQGGKMWAISFSKVANIYYDDLKVIGNIYENPELL